MDNEKTLSPERRHENIPATQNSHSTFRCIRNNLLGGFPTQKIFNFHLKFTIPITNPNNSRFRARIATNKNYTLILKNALFKIKQLNKKKNLFN